MTETMETSTAVRAFDPEMLVRRGNYTVLITPEVAADLLERNHNNRPPKRRAIKMYARDMQAGNWDPDASDIKTDVKGDLVDGQNRLMACVESGASFATLLRSCVNVESKQHVDQGVRRTVADTFGMANVGEARNVATAVNLRIRYEHLLRTTSGAILKDPRVAQTHQEAIDYLAAHPMVEKWANTALRMQRLGPGIPPSIYVAFLSMAAESSEHMAQQFADAFIEGKSTGTGDPVLALFRYAATVQKHRIGNPGTAGKYMALKHLLAFVRAWNAWVEATPLPQIIVKETDRLVPAV